MELLSTTSEVKGEESCQLSSQTNQTKINKQIQKNKTNIKNHYIHESRKQSFKNFKVHQTLKPKEQKMNCIFIKSKYWKRKKLVGVSSNVSDIQVSNKLVLFNELQIETYYEDQEPYQIYDLSQEINRVSSICKNNTQRILEMNLCSQLDNKQYTFKFLIDHFRKIPEPQYQSLYQSLQKYQMTVTSMYCRLHSIQKQIQKEESYYQEVLDQSNAIYSNVREKVKQYCQKLNQNSKSNQCFYLYKIQRVNYQSKSNDFTQIGISYDLLSVLGLNEDRNENFPLSFYNSLIQITKQYNGEQRIDTQIKILEAMNNYDEDVKDIKIILQSLDFLDLYCSANIHYIYPDQVPSWMGKEDVCAQIWSFSICDELLQQTNELRKQSSIQAEYSCQDNIEYCMTRDLFFNKFYPTTPSQ
ncbi:hypothetical protein TTHERM_00420500 (macronuclear) [Tetrahymena thermophila SB210]|uniref:Uncharacterized protein n=1 Tax=Tetrahymena thermophila (strain SB210) TaxID=312017 RepID=I7MH03_TETTS|nr:hypothetical protein TTHERM_00420500 [Tetrahymena thermophila SB210]EAR85642.1 hypothetical protein TTHERM_00420500 [Tetrahymena thermophila SB210]|eukprot:XP_001033305.1 hypothetical protein TTHERM_00420500 [Tetrahymena thermophila SB210]